MDNQDRCGRRCGDGLKKIFDSAYIWSDIFLNEVLPLISNEGQDNIGQLSLELPLFDTSPE